MYLALLLAEVALATLALTIAYQIVYYRFFHPLSRFPGPFWASITRLWLVYHTAKGDEAEVCFELHERHGPVIRISPTFLTVSDAHLLPLIYHRDADKTPHDAPMVANAPESLFTLSDHKAHARARRMIGRPYTPSATSRLEPLIDEHITSWTTRLASLYASAGTPATFDLAPWCSYLSFDVISSLAFGAPLGFVEAASDVSNLIHGLHTGWLVFGALQRLHPLRTWLTSTRLFRRLFIPKPKNEGSATTKAPTPSASAPAKAKAKSQPSGFGHLLAERDRLIDARLAAVAAAGGTWTGRADMLAALLDARDEAGKALPLSVVRMEVMSILVAGADTTGTTLQSFLVELLRQPAMLERCTAEVRTAARQGSWGSRPPTAAEVHAACPWFEACLRETMRLRPAAPNFMPRLVSAPGMVLPCGGGEARAPAGTEISANIWVVGRDRNVYGEDALDWRPERWLTADGKVDGARVRDCARYALTWGAGARTCLGQSIAWMELLKAGSEILRRFDVRRGAGHERWVVKGGVGWWEDVLVQLFPAVES